MRVLVAVATRHGATGEIAEQVALAMTSALDEAMSGRTSTCSTPRGVIVADEPGGNAAEQKA